MEVTGKLNARFVVECSMRILASTDGVDRPLQKDGETPYCAEARIAVARAEALAKKLRESLYLP